MDKDFACWKMADESPGYEKRRFAFMAHPYILSPATKAQALYYDNRSVFEQFPKLFKCRKNFRKFYQGIPNTLEFECTLRGG
jgi:hypothetical protein